MATCSSEVSEVVKCFVRARRTRRQRKLHLVYSLLMLGGAACETGGGEGPSASAAPEPNGNCVAGSQVDCACSDGSRGVTTCDASGQTPRACMCRDAVGTTTASTLGTTHD